jgi:hypothetical protein
MGMAGRKLGAAIAGIGLAVIAAGVFAGGASAQDSESEAEVGFQCPAESYTFTWAGNVDEDATEISGEGTTYSDGSFTVTLSNAGPTVGETLDYWHVGSVDFAASAPVSAVQVVLWQPGNTTETVVVTFEPEVTEGTITSPEGSLGEDGQAPIKGLLFCFEKPVVTTTTTTIAPATTSTSVAPEQVIVPTTAAPTTTTVAPTEVLPQVETAPQIAFTGSSSGPLVAIGAVLVLLGLSLVGVDRLGLVRRFRHSR